MFANRNANGKWLLSLYEVDKKVSREDAIGMHLPTSERELAVVYLREDSIGDEIHHFRIGRGSYGRLGDYVASRQMVHESPETHVALFWGQLMIWISGSVWFIDIQTG